MSKRVIRRRGTTAQHEGFVGPVGEVTFDTTMKTIRLHDGETSGGIVVPPAAATPGLASDNEFTGHNEFTKPVAAAAATQPTHAVRKAQLDAHAGATSGVHGAPEGSSLIHDGQVVRIDQNNWVATAEPTVDDDSTKGYVVGSRWYYADGSPYVQWVCVDASEGEAEWVPVQERREVFIAGLGGEFAAHPGAPRAIFKRKGNTVEIFPEFGNAPHSTSSAPNGGLVPLQFRPSGAARHNVYHSDNQGVRRISVNGDGELTLEYRTWDGNLFSDSESLGFFITYDL